MDVRNSRARVFSILNDNDSPSFVIRHNSTQSAHPPPPSAKLQPALEPHLERPNFLRGAQYTKRQSSFSSVSSVSSPPFLRHDSSSSKSSSGSMESSPSPITPAYNYNDTTFLPYGDLLRQDFLPSPTSITPFMEQQMMIAPMPDQLPHFSSKAMGGLPPIAPPQYPLLPGAPSQQQHQQQRILTPAPSLQSAATSTSTPAASAKPSPQNATNAPTGKKNKYPCPYATSHSCSATFTTSGHAARHGKKHTGEKGVHCPICNKAFTRKDNMKQHERTHKGATSGTASDDQPARRSKAAITKEAQKAKTAQSESQAGDLTRKANLVHSPLSEVTSLTPSVIETPIAMEEPVLYQNPAPQSMMPTDVGVSASMSMYPPLGEDTMMNATNPLMLQPFDPTKQNLLPELAPPPLMRGFSDLDTLAQAAAESYEPYYQQPKYPGL